MLHRAGRLDYLRQKHLAFAEELSDEVHPVHEGAFDDVHGRGIDAEGFLEVALEAVGDAPAQRVYEAFGE